MRQIFHLYQERFAKLFSGVKDFHLEMERQRKGNQGHGIDHDVLVAGYVILIQGKKTRVTEMAWVAAMIHSIDRLAGVETESILKRLLGLLPVGYFTEIEIGTILQAVREHSGPNREQDSEVKIVLQDADRLANIGACLIIRSGQLYPHIPAVEVQYLSGNPESTFRQPRSCRDDIAFSLEWESGAKFGLRTHTAKLLGKPYFDFLRLFLATIKRQYEETGLEGLEI